MYLFVILGRVNSKRNFSETENFSPTLQTLIIHGKYTFLVAGTVKKNLFPKGTILIGMTL